MICIPSFSEILAVAQSRGTDSAAPHLWDGLAGAWTFQEGGGDTVFDLAGSGNEGILDSSMDPATDWVIGENGHALEFNDGNERVLVSDPAGLDTSPDESDGYSISLWFRTPSAGTDEDLIREPSGTQNYRIFLDVGRIRRIIRDSDSVSMDETFGSTNQFYDDIWHHAVEIIDFVNDVEKLYVDGVDTNDDETVAFTGRVGMHNSLSIVRELVGQASDVRIWTRRMSDVEISQLYRDPWAAYRLRRKVYAVPAAAASILPLVNHYMAS